MMRPRAIAALILLGVATLEPALADQPTIADTDAAAHMGQTATVEGLACPIHDGSAALSSAVDFLNGGQDAPWRRS